MLHENSIVVYDYPVLRRGAYGPCPMYFMLETQRKQLLLLFLDNSWTSLEINWEGLCEVLKNITWTL